MTRDIDQIIKRLQTEAPGIRISQLEVAHPGADDDGLWFISVPDKTEDVQIESSYGQCPFLIESNFDDERRYGRTVEEVVSTMLKLLGIPYRGHI